MIFKDGQDAVIEKRKARLGLSGDVYVYNHRIEDIAGHKRLFPESTAETIEDAEAERIAFEEELERKRAEEAARVAEELETAPEETEQEEI